MEDAARFPVPDPLPQRILGQLPGLPPVRAGPLPQPQLGVCCHRYLHVPPSDSFSVPLYRFTDLW